MFKFLIETFFTLTIIYITALSIAFLLCLLSWDFTGFSNLVGFLIPGQQYRKFKRKAKKNNAPLFTAKQIKSFYYTAPKKWKFNFKLETLIIPQWTLSYSPDSYNEKVIGVKNIFDFWELRIFFVKNNRKNKMNDKNLSIAKNTAMIIQYVRQDAEKAQNEADNLQKKQEEELQEILSRLQTK